MTHSFSLKNLIFLVYFLMANGLFAQQDSLIQLINKDTLATQIDSVLSTEKQIRSPKSIALLSLALPGAGHIYNKKYWKAPLVYAAMGGVVYAIDYNTRYYHLLQSAYCKRLVQDEVLVIETNANGEEVYPDGHPCTKTRATAFIAKNQALLDGLVAQKTSESLKNTRDSFDKNRQLSWIGLVGVHLIFNTAWSFVDAHLIDFDLDDDLSLRLKPSLESTPLGATPAVGLGIVIPLNVGD